MFQAGDILPPMKNGYGRDHAPFGVPLGAGGQGTTNTRGQAADTTGQSQTTSLQIAPAANATLPRGVRNNNPGNLRPLGRDQWLGQTGVDREGSPLGFSVFDSPVNGLRALGINTITKQRRDGRNTIREILSNHADAREGDPVNEYVRFVSEHMGLPPDIPINTQNPAILRPLMEGIIMFENGRGALNNYSSAQLNEGVNLSIEHHNNRQRR